MERIQDYGGFIVWFLGLGYLAGWAIAPDRLAAMPPSVHAIGMTAIAFLPWRVWVYWQGRRRHRPIEPAKPAAVTTYRAPLLPPPRRPVVKPRAHFGLRGMPPSPR